MKKILLRSLGVILVFVILMYGYISVAYSEVDSQLRLRGLIYDQFIQFDDVESLSKMSKASREQLMNQETNVEYDQIYIHTEDGDQIRCLVYRSKNSKENATGLLWFHGGGYASLVPESDLSFVETIVGDTNSVVLIPDYTLSVDEPYPAALDDAYTSLLWMKNHAEELGINKDQIFVGGGSAGGGLTASTTLYARDKGQVSIAFQLPLFPMINDKMDKPSGINNTAFIWNSQRNAIAWEAYLGDYYQTNDVPVYASPLRESDFSGLPPTFTYVGSIDPFRDDTIAYVNELRQVGTDVEFYEYKGAYHGFEGMVPNADISRLAIKRLVKAYKHATENYFSPQED